MASYQVTQTDIDELGAFASANNVIGYYTKLSQLGDRYAGMALGVVGANTFEGNLARQFAQNAASWQAGTAVTITGQAWANISIELMQADLAARTIAHGAPGEPVPQICTGR